MSIFEDRAKYSHIGKIREFIISLGYLEISDSSSQNQIFVNNNSIITIRKKTN